MDDTSFKPIHYGTRATANVKLAADLFVAAMSQAEPHPIRMAMITQLQSHIAVMPIEHWDALPTVEQSHGAKVYMDLLQLLCDRAVVMERLRCDLTAAQKEGSQQVGVAQDDDMEFER